jgi:CRP-like cAMP-binding protein
MREQHIMQTDVDALRKADLFASLPEEHLAQLALRSQHRRFPAGARVFDAGDPGTTLYVIVSGRVSITTREAGGKEITLAELGPGEVFGDLALLDGLPRSAAVVATSETDCVTLHRDDFLELVESEPAAVRAVLRSLAGVIRHMNSKLAEYGSHSYSDRLAKELLDLARQHGEETPHGTLINRPLSMAELASRVGIWEGEVRSLMAVLQYEGIVVVVGDTVTVARPNALGPGTGLAGGAG